MVRGVGPPTLCTYLFRIATEANTNSQALFWYAHHIYSMHGKKLPELGHKFGFKCRSAGHKGASRESQPARGALCNEPMKWCVVYSIAAASINHLTLGKHQYIKYTSI